MSQPSANVGTILAGRVNGAIITSRGGTALEVKIHGSLFGELTLTSRHY
jgi:hypothetical protein